VKGGALQDAEEFDTTLRPNSFKDTVDSLSGGKLGTLDPRRSIFRLLRNDESFSVPRMTLPGIWDLWGYKLVAKVGQRYFSLWAGESAEYEIGVEIRDEALPHRKGGLYICDSPASAARQYIATSFPGKSLCVAMLRCACKGPFIDYGGGKAACSALTPLDEVPLPADGDAAGPPAGLWHRLHSSKTRGASSDENARMASMPGWEVTGYTVAAKMGQPPLRNRYFSLWMLEAARLDLDVAVRDDALTDPTKDHLLIVRDPTEALSIGITLAEKLQSSGIDQAPRVLLRCACEGPFAELPDGRVACARITPLDEVAIPESERDDEASMTDRIAAEFVPMLPEQKKPTHPAPRKQIEIGKQPRPPPRPGTAPFHGKRYHSRQIITRR
jgi:hypothetical protein